MCTFYCQSAYICLLGRLRPYLGEGRRSAFMLWARRYVFRIVPQFAAFVLVVTAKSAWTEPSVECDQKDDRHLAARSVSSVIRLVASPTRQWLLANRKWTKYSRGTVDEPWRRLVLRRRHSLWHRVQHPKNQTRKPTNWWRSAKRDVTNPTAIVTSSTL